MKKAISLLLCIVICFLLCACNSNTLSTSNATTSKTDLPQEQKGNKANINTDLLQYQEGITINFGRCVIFDSYDRFLAHVSEYANVENSYLHFYKQYNHNNLNEFVDELTAKDHIEFPYIDDELAPLQSPHAIMLGRNCIEYFTLYRNTRVFVNVTYPHIEEYEDFSQDLSASEVLKMIIPYPVNVDTFEKYKELESEHLESEDAKSEFVIDPEFDRYKAVYEKEIRLADRTLPAVVYEEKDNDEKDDYERRTVVFYYKGMLLSVLLVDNPIYNSDFFEHFSMQ